jgi:hypothetical protein
MRSDKLTADLKIRSALLAVAIMNPWRTIFAALFL